MASAVASRPNLPSRSATQPVPFGFPDISKQPNVDGKTVVTRIGHPVRSMLDVHNAPLERVAPGEGYGSGYSLGLQRNPALDLVHHRLNHVGMKDSGMSKMQVSVSLKPLPPTPTPMQAPKSSVASEKPTISLQTPQRLASRKEIKATMTPNNITRGTSPSTSPKGEGRSNLLWRARSFLKRQNSKANMSQENFVPSQHLHMDGAADKHATAISPNLKKHPESLLSSSHSSYTSRSRSTSSPSSHVSISNEAGPKSSKDDSDANTVESISTLASIWALPEQPRIGVTWGIGSTDSGVKFSLSSQRMFASNEQLPGVRRQSQFLEEDGEDHPWTPLQATFSTKAVEGVGLKARRLSLTLPEDFVVMTKELEKEYKSTKLFHSKGNIIGKGATAKVTTMCRKDGSKDELYAVKEFRDREKDETEHEHVQKIMSEYTLAHSVSHPNIVHTFALCVDKRKRYNHVMEYCPMELYSIAEKGLFKTFYTYEARLCFFKQILRAVGYLHRHGIAHRDIKLENILMDTNGHLKLTDFGVSEVFCGEHPGARSSGGKCGQHMGVKRLCPPGICGSLPYISPEVLEHKSYDPTKLDSWSCGVLWLTLACSGSLWMKPSEDAEHYATFINGWREWFKKYPDAVPDEETGYPNCGPFMKLAGPPAIKKVMLKLMHPNPDKRISVHDALKSTVIKNAECCCPDSYDDQSQSLSGSKRPFNNREKLYKHNHIPTKEHKIPRALLPL